MRLNGSISERNATAYNLSVARQPSTAKENFQSSVGQFIDEEMLLSPLLHSINYSERNRTIKEYIDQGLIPQNVIDSSRTYYSKGVYETDNTVLIDWLNENYLEDGKQLQSDAELEESRNSELDVKREYRESIMSRATMAGDVAGFGGMLFASAVAPENILTGFATYPLTGVFSLANAVRAGKNINRAMYLKGVAKTGFVTGATEAAMIEPFIHDWKEEIGAEYSITDSLLNIAASGIFNAGLTTSASSLEGLFFKNFSSEKLGDRFTMHKALRQLGYTKEEADVALDTVETLHNAAEGEKLAEAADVQERTEAEEILFAEEAEAAAKELEPEERVDSELERLDREVGKLSKGEQLFVNQQVKEAKKGQEDNAQKKAYSAILDARKKREIETEKDLSQSEIKRRQDKRDAEKAETKRAEKKYSEKIKKAEKVGDGLGQVLLAGGFPLGRIDVVEAALKVIDKQIASFRLTKKYDVTDSESVQSFIDKRMKETNAPKELVQLFDKVKFRVSKLISSGENISEDIIAQFEELFRKLRREDRSAEADIVDDVIADILSVTNVKKAIRANNAIEQGQYSKGYEEVSGLNKKEFEQVTKARIRQNARKKLSESKTEPVTGQEFLEELEALKERIENPNLRMSEEDSIDYNENEIELISLEDINEADMLRDPETGELVNASEYFGNRKEIDEEWDEVWKCRKGDTE